MRDHIQKMGKWYALVAFGILFYTLLQNTNHII